MDRVKKWYLNKMEISIKYKKEPKRNSGSEQYNNWNEEFTQGTQKQIWAGRNISKLEVRIEIIKSEEQKEKEWSQQSLRDQHMHCRSPRRKRERGREIDKIMAENFSTLMTAMNGNTQEHSHLDIF